MAEEIPYQQAPQVRQLLAERANAEAYGQVSRVDAVDKQLNGLGWVDPAKAAKARAAAAAKEEEEKGGEPRTQPPKGRTTRQQQTTAEGDKPRT